MNDWYRTTFTAVTSVPVDECVYPYSDRAKLTSQQITDHLFVSGPCTELVLYKYIKDNSTRSVKKSLLGPCPAGKVEIFRRRFFNAFRRQIKTVEISTLIRRLNFDVEIFLRFSTLRRRHCPLGAAIIANLFMEHLEDLALSIHFTHFEALVVMLMIE